MAAGSSANNLRKLAAIDIAYLGYPLIFVEFACGVVLSAALGIFVLHRAHSFWQFVLGSYLVCLGINYTPMLVYTVSIGNRVKAQAEMGGELTDRKAAMAKYRKQSLLLLVPLAGPLVALTHKLRISQARAAD